jgi:hypothetical protein
VNDQTTRLGEGDLLLDLFLGARSDNPGPGKKQAQDGTYHFPEVPQLAHQGKPLSSENQANLDAAAAGDRTRVEALAAAHSWITVREKRDAQAAGLIAAEARAIADRRDVDALTEFAAEHTWLEVQRVKATDEVLSRAVALYKGAGWRELPRTKTGTSISAEAEHLQQVVRPAPGAPEDAAADLRALISPDMIGHLQAWVDAGEPERIERALACANDPGLAAHMARQKCGTYDKAFLARLDARSRRQDPERYPDPDGPARYGVSTFKATGRTGIRGDIGQNWPQRGGVRECIVPRRGRVFLCVDYAACEMSTFADVLDMLVSIFT